ncbi:hypothetical protein LLEC1_05835 [Akanthomyces lecanii]|uniref:F-box domain-containing protein n=1 Tax=Cordyceps confragosa TaxID=2714763 RepID=A0A179I8V1_CORDF|nr:hypothetical protein LLEC1_05835 [Akanthomyces lecanii]
MDSDSLPPPPPSSPLAPASSDGQLMIRARSPTLSICRHAHAPTATSGPPPEHTPHDDVVATGTGTSASPRTRRFSDAQPLMAAHGGYQDASRNTSGPRALTYTLVSLSRDLGPSIHDPSFQTLPAEIMLHILGYLDVPDLLPTSRVSTEQASPRCPRISSSPMQLFPISADWTSCSPTPTP